MVHLFPVRQFVDNHVVQHVFRSKDEPPVEVEVPLAAAASPSGLLFADGDPSVGHIHNAGIIFGLAGEDIPRDFNIPGALCCRQSRGL